MPMTHQKNKQLDQIKLPMIQLEDGSFLIKKNSKPKELTLEKNHYYIIHLDDGDVAKEMMSLTSVNWNQGVEIKSNYLKCELVKKLGNMVCLNASGYDPDHDLDLDDIYLNIWVNSNIINILKEI